MNIFVSTIHLLVKPLLFTFSKVALFIGDFAILHSCRGMLHEEEVPVALQKQNPFLK